MGKNIRTPIEPIEGIPKMLILKKSSHICVSYNVPIINITN